MRVAVSWPVATSHNFTDLSVARRGDGPRTVRAERNIPNTVALCPVSVAVSWPVATSHNLTVSSQAPRGDPLAVRAERNTHDFDARVPVEGVRVSLPVVYIPQPHRLVGNSPRRPCACRPG